jgi:hypothetical protein
MMNLPKDHAKTIIRMDGITRNNLGVSIGDTIVVNKAASKLAENVVIRPYEAIPPIDERYFADALDGQPVTEGDNVLIPYFGGRLTFRVIKVRKMGRTDNYSEDNTAAIVTQQTKFGMTDREAEVKLQTNEILRKEDGEIVLVFKFSLFCNDIIESGEFQHKLTKNKDKKIELGRLPDIFVKYNGIAKEWTKTAEHKVLELPSKEKEIHPEIVERILKEAKLEILRRCAEVE